MGADGVARRDYGDRRGASALTMPDDPAQRSAGIGRRFGAIVYDALILIGVLAIATFPFLPFLNGKVLVPREVGALAYGYWLWELLLVTGFFVFFWTRRGQTLGMLAWRLRIQRADGENLRWRDAVRRLALVAALLTPAAAGYQLVWREWNDANARTLATVIALLPFFAAYFWIWIDRDRLAWHDRWSGTRVVVAPKKV
jgi:uncharacterized RDD family membrane protein YckC